MDSQDLQISQQIQILPPTQQQIIENNNNNQPSIDPSQKRRLSRAHENNLDKTTMQQMENCAKTGNDTHYIKNKILQSPVSRYKVGEVGFQIDKKMKIIIISLF